MYGRVQQCKDACAPQRNREKRRDSATEGGEGMQHLRALHVFFRSDKERRIEIAPHRDASARRLTKRQYCHIATTPMPRPHCTNIMAVVRTAQDAHPRRVMCVLRRRKRVCACSPSRGHLGHDVIEESSACIHTHTCDQCRSSDLLSSNVFSLLSLPLPPSRRPAHLLPFHPQKCMHLVGA